MDIASQAIHFTEAKGLSVQRFDLTQAGVELPGVPYDVAISCEVAEHLDAAHADEFVRKLTAAAPVVYLTGAEPNTGLGPGLHHVNEQPHSYCNQERRDEERERRDHRDHVLPRIGPVGSQVCKRDRKYLAKGAKATPLHLVNV